MKISFIELPSPTKRVRKIIEEKVFKYYYENKGYSRKQFKTKLGIGPAIFNRTLYYYYTPLDIEKLRVNKIRSTSALHRPIRWKERAIILESINPGISDLVESGNYIEAINKLIEINDFVYEAKESLRLVMKHVRHGAQRRNIKVNFVANALEFKVKKILDELKLDYVCQYRIGKRLFDFKLIDHKILIEVDGRFHSESKDKIKDKLASKKGYYLLRLLEKEIKHVHFIKDKINNAVREAKGM